MKEVNTIEATQLITEVSRSASVYVKLADEYGNQDKKILMNDSHVYKLNGEYIGITGGDDEVAKRVVKEIKESSDWKFSIYSSYFSYATGDYQIV